MFSYIFYPVAFYFPLVCYKYYLDKYVNVPIVCSYYFNNTINSSTPILNINYKFRENKDKNLFQFCKIISALSNNVNAIFKIYNDDSIHVKLSELNCNSHQQTLKSFVQLINDDCIYFRLDKEKDSSYNMNISNSSGSSESNEEEKSEELMMNDDTSDLSDPFELTDDNENTVPVEKVKDTENDENVENDENDEKEEINSNIQTTMQIDSNEQRHSVNDIVQAIESN